MSRPLRMVLVLLLGAAAVGALVFAAAWFLMPRDWIDTQARRQVALMKGTSVRWTRMTPAIQWLSIGVKLEGLIVRVPDVGPPKTDLRANEVFVSMKLFPLLSRRVEVSSADRKSTRLNSSHEVPSRMPSSA